MNIVLIGMSSVGKSKSGKIVAEILNMPYFDEDDNLEDTNNMFIQVMRKTMTEEEFRRKKQENLIYMYSLDNCVISAGGRTGMIENLRPKFKEKTLVILLKPSLEYILNRYEKKKSDTSPANLRRQLVFDTVENITKQYKIRYDLMMENADIIIDTTNMKKHDVAHQISELYDNLKK